MKAPSDIATTARLPPHGPLCAGSLMVFSSLLRTSMSTMLGRRPQEPLSCLNRRMGRQRDDIELRISRDIDGCSWHETSPHAIHDHNVDRLCAEALIATGVYGRILGGRLRRFRDTSGVQTECLGMD